MPESKKVKKVSPGTDTGTDTDMAPIWHGGSIASEMLVSRPGRVLTLHGDDSIPFLQEPEPEIIDPIQHEVAVCDRNHLQLGPPHPLIEQRTVF